jgi:spermidine synthase
MLRSLNRLLIIIGFGSFLVLARLGLAGRFASFSSTSFLIAAAVLGLAAIVATVVLYYFLRKVTAFLDNDAAEQARFLDTLDIRYVDVAIFITAALSLLLELALIRWQSSVLEFVAFYKNFSLLACFAGLGLGYGLAGRDRIPLLTVIPLLAWQFGFLMMTRLVPVFGSIPFPEQLTMGLGKTNLVQAAALYLLLTVVFLLTAVTFLPVGQLCGRLMERRSKLRAYGLNLLGSLAGVLLMLGESFAWTPPLVWFALCFLALLLFHVRKSSTMLTASLFTLVGATALAWWPINPLWNRVYTPYQLLEIYPNDTGYTEIRAAGHYYQHIHNLAGECLTAEMVDFRNYYDFAYKASPALADVAVVGAGTGNDVAAALRAGAGKVDAIEIDPAILQVGKMSHPEKPYTDPRTTAVNDDARSFLRRTDRMYDLIVYGLLDSHTLLSQGSSVRLDSFVYTIEGLREARSRLKPDGMIALSFVVLSDSLARKIYLMMEQAFDGRPPICIATGFTGAVIFLESNDSNWKLPPTLIADTGFIEMNEKYADPALHADVSTDDWPFFYMPERVFPKSYLVMIFQIVALSLLLAANFLNETPKFSHLSFFFLGVGFMLIETKGITEMGLTFGNTWHIIGIVIAGILLMAFLGNCAVQWFNIKNTFIPYLLLWASLGIGWYVSKLGGFESTTLGRLETAIVLTCPLLFSGILFSTLLANRGHVAGIMAMNLLGAICGGLLEYSSMYLGFRSLYVLAAVCYVLAFLSELLLKDKEAAVL